MYIYIYIDIYIYICIYIYIYISMWERKRVRDCVLAYGGVGGVRACMCLSIF